MVRRSGAAIVIGAGLMVASVVVAAEWRSRSAETPLPPPELPLTRRLIADGTQVWVAGRTPDGGEEWIAGAARFVVSPSGRVRAAPMRFSVDIAAAAPVADGWVFVTTNGDVARSDTFLGELRELGRVRDRIQYVTRNGVGRAAFVGLGGDLWTTAGSGPPVREDLPGRVTQAVFGDEQRGVALLDDLRLAVTTDGARTWSLAPLAGEFARDIYLSAVGVTVLTTGGRLVLEDDGVLRHRPTALRSDGWRSVTAGVVLHRMNEEGAKIRAVYAAGPGATSLGEPRGWPVEPDAATSPGSYGHYRCRYAGTEATTARPVSPDRTASRGHLTTRARGETPVLAWVGPGGEVVPIPEPALDEGEERALSIRQVLALPEGGVVVSLASPAADLDISRDAGVALEVGPDGRVRGRRAFVWGRGELAVGIARRGRCAGPVVGPNPHGVARMTPILDDAPACHDPAALALPPLDGSALRPCRRATTADVVVFATRRPHLSLESDEEPLDGPGPTLLSGDARATVEWSDGAYCLREVTARAWPDGGREREVTLVARGAGLEGWVELGAEGPRPSWRRLRCEPRTAP